MTKKITFSLPAVAMEGATEAYLLGDFNNWNQEIAPKLKKQKDGSFKTVASLEEGKTYEYRFLLNDGRWVNDYNAQSYTKVKGLHIDNCVITIPVSTKEENKKEQPANSRTAKPGEVKAKAEKKITAPAPSRKASPAKPAKKTAPKAAAVKAEQPAKQAEKKTASKTKK